MNKREKGVATTPCPTCTADLPLEVRPDGGMAASRCEECHPTPGAEKAARTSSPKREKGTPAIESEEDND